MRRPSFQFYPADWRNNANLRRCSWAARGVWVEIMGLMHDSDDYGILRWSLKEIAQALGCPVALVKELATKDVLKGCDSGQCGTLIYVPRSGRKDGDPVTLVSEQPGPIWYSSRMVKDEYVRSHAGASTRFQPNKSDTQPEDGSAPSRRQGERQGEPPSGRRGDGSTSSSSPTGRQHTSQGSVVEPPPSPQVQDATQPTREGLLCRRLRAVGIQDAAPHLLRSHDWQALLARRTDEDIVGIAEAKVAQNPGKRISLNYLAPALAEEARPIPQGGPHERTASTVAAFTGGDRKPESRVIDCGTAERAA